MSIAEKLATITENEQKVYDAGYNNGFLQGFSEGEANGQRLGYNNGYADGHISGENAGRQDMNEAWWVAISGNYTRTDWGYAFQYADLSKVGEPKKTIDVTVMARMFTYYKGESIPKIFNCSKATDATHIVRYTSTLKAFPDLNISALSKYGGTWQGCTALETIEMIRCDENSIFDATFHGCVALKDVTFEGVIGQNISFGDSSGITRETLLSNGDGGVFAKLKDYFGTGITHTITLHQTTKDKLEQAELAIATQKGWTIA